MIAAEALHEITASFTCDDPLKFREALPEVFDGDLDELALLFPPANCPFKPCGGWVVLQDKAVLAKTKGGLWKPDLSREDMRRRMETARVVDLGPTAGWDEILGDYLPGWPWFDVGDFVKISPHSQTRSDETPSDLTKLVDRVVFRQVHFRDVLARIITAAAVLKEDR